MKKSTPNNKVTIIHTCVLVSTDRDLFARYSNFMMAENYILMCADSLIDAAITIMEKKIDILIVDIDIIGVDSLKMIYIINQIKPRLPILVITSDNSIESNRRLLEHGVQYIELKPINDYNLMNVIRKIHQIRTKNQPKQ